MHSIRKGEQQELFEQPEGGNMLATIPKTIGSWVSKWIEIEDSINKPCDWKWSHERVQGSWKDKSFSTNFTNQWHGPSFSKGNYNGQPVSTDFTNQQHGSSFWREQLKDGNGV